MEHGQKEIRMNIVIMNRQYGDIVGGVERASVRLANEMIARGHNVHIISLDLPDAWMAFQLDGRAVWHRISNISAKRKAGFKERVHRHCAIHKILKQHKIDAGIGFQDGAYLSLVMGAIGTGVPVIAAERNAPSRFDYMSSRHAKFIAFNSFRLAARVTLQCASYAGSYPGYLQNKIIVIPNSVDAAKMRADAAGMNKDVKEIVFVGRLDYQKNPGALLSAFAKIHTVFPDWILRFVGGGPYEDGLRAQAEQLGIAPKVLFEGMQKDVEKYYAGAQIFCLPSLWEGFPNALGEAMAHGLPSVGFKSCSGVCDLIEDGVTGFLAEGKTDDVESLSQNLAKLMGSDDARAAMGAASREAMKAYAPQKIYDRWEELFRSVKRR